MSRSNINIEQLSTAQAVAKQATAYSVATNFKGCAGNAALYIVSTAGSVTISQQCSADGVTYYDPVDTAGSAIGVIRTALTVTTGVYVPFTPVLAPYARFKVVEGNSAATVITLKLVFRSEV
jgi:hypothetical protein